MAHFVGKHLDKWFVVLYLLGVVLLCFAVFGGYAPYKVDAEQVNQDVLWGDTYGAMPEDLKTCGDAEANDECVLEDVK